MKVTCPLMSALPTPLTCPLRIMCMTSYLGTCSICRLEGKETHPWLDQPLDEAMVLFDDVVEILDADVSSTLSGKTPLALRSAIALGEAACLSTLITRGTGVMVLGSAAAIGVAICSSDGRA